MTLYKAYVSIQNQHVYYYPDESPWEFEVVAERNIIPIFQKLFDQVKMVESSNFLRAQKPIELYHHDRENDQYDRRLKKIYALIHEFSNEESRNFIEQLPYFNPRRSEAIGQNH
ncbi:transposase [Bacillus sp. FJAT-22090]|uniref:transposase n=1 Tax=Bacillus sp. FJAT-22090 TaxID=1581038 RepID=UPI0011AAA23D|nr:transposase [Bacillus sp. FJAT-22090]